MKTIPLLSLLLGVWLANDALAQTTRSISDQPTPVPTKTEEMRSLEGTMSRLKALIEATESSQDLTAPTTEFSQRATQLPTADADSNPVVDDFQGVLERVRALQGLKNQLKTQDSSVPRGHMVKTEAGGMAMSEQVQNAAPVVSGPQLGSEESSAAIQVESNAGSEERILDAPADPLRLAQSLYKTKNYEAALKVLDSMDHSNLSQSDAEWSEFLSAICNKRMGDVEKASAILRELSNEKNAKVFSSETKWWLSHFERHRTRQEQTDRILDQADITREDAMAYVRDAQ